jgi:mono/diheme cytochrome c family protein
MMRLEKAIPVGFFFLVLFLFAALALAQKQPKKTPGLLDQGKKLYQKSCAHCHGSNGDGKGQLSTSLKTPPGDFTKPFSQWRHTGGDPRKVFDAITNGVPDTAMAKFRYSEEERWALTYAVIEFSKGR